MTRASLRNAPREYREEVEYRARYDEDFGVDTRPDRREDDPDIDEIIETLDDDRR